MSVPVEASVVEYEGDGRLMSFPVPFLFHAAEHLTATLLREGDATASALTRGVDYEVTVAGGRGGTLVLSVAAPPRSLLTIERVVPVVQQEDLTEAPYSPAASERALDALCFAHQQVARRLPQAEADMAALEARVTALEARAAADFVAGSVAAVAYGPDLEMGMQRSITFPVGGGTLRFDWWLSRDLRPLNTTPYEWLGDECALTIPFAGPALWSAYQAGQGTVEVTLAAGTWPVAFIFQQFGPDETSPDRRFWVDNIEARDVNGVLLERWTFDDGVLGQPPAGWGLSPFADMVFVVQRR